MTSGHLCLSTACGAVRRRAVARLLQILAVSCFGVGNATGADSIQVEVPPECSAESRTSDTTYPFIDRLGDPRFAPRPLHIAPDAGALVRPDLHGMLASAALMADQKTLLIATYLDILSLNIETGKVTTVEVDFGNLSNKRYVPTGIAVGHQTGRVFLANYEANNILIGHVIGNRIIFDQEVADDSVVSPENVAIAPDESWLVSANFDGGSATAFELAGGRYTQKWQAAIPFAHGIAILDDMVFVSSIGLRKIIALDLYDGHKIGSFGQPGWNASCLDFLWPTGISVGVNNIIVITDAHTGGVYRIAFDGRVGKLLDVVGGSAPGAAGLQMPYSAASVGADLAILSTFSPKVLVVGPSQSSEAPAIKTLIVQQAHQAERDSDRERPLPLGVGWNGYVHLAAAPIRVSGFLTVPSYTWLTRVTHRRTLKTNGFLWLGTDALLLFGATMYFIDGHAVEKGVVLSSPSAPYAVYVTQGQASCFAMVALPGPAFATNAGLEYGSGMTGYDEVERQALARLQGLDLRRGSDDFVPLSTIAEGLQLPPDGVREAIRTNAGKDALAALARCHEQSCSREESKAVIDRYKTQVATSSDAPFFELLLLDMSANRCAG
jgi:hypothetical protein